MASDRVPHAAVEGAIMLSEPSMVITHLSKVEPARVRLMYPFSAMTAEIGGAVGPTEGGFAEVLENDIWIVTSKPLRDSMREQITRHGLDDGGPDVVHRRLLQTRQEK